MEKLKAEKVSIVSMPCLGRFHFYNNSRNVHKKPALCQCPVSGDSISTKLIRTFSHIFDVSMPCLGRFHFYSVEARKNETLRIVSMPCLGRFHFYGKKAVCEIKNDLCQCPVSGDSISTSSLSSRTISKSCVNALSRAIPFLRSRLTV